MAQYDWSNCPTATKTQVEQFLQVSQITLRANLVGVYLHGSLALKCFNPQRSDLDLLVILNESMTVDTKRTVVGYLLKHSRSPHAIEVSYLAPGDVKPWKFPTPFDLHYGEDHREAYQMALKDESWRTWNDERKTDLDLAAHIMVTRVRGITLVGPPATELFPDVPEADYRVSILADFDFARERIHDNPVYAVLNMCRVFQYLSRGGITSKDEAGQWALEALATEYQGVVAQALEVYRGQIWGREWNANALDRFAGYLNDKVSVYR